jgi:hypothetical protein
MNRVLTRAEIDRALYRSKPRLTVWDNTPAISGMAIALGVTCWLVIAAAIVVLGSVL